MAIVTRFMEAWNSERIDRILDVYHLEVRYRDPNTRGEVKGREALRHYLARLLSAWSMRWETREVIPLLRSGDPLGCALLWRAELVHRDSGSRFHLEGMDLLELRGALVVRNEVYFDRSPFLELIT